MERSRHSRRTSSRRIPPATPRPARPGRGASPARAALLALAILSASLAGAQDAAKAADQSATAAAAAKDSAQAAEAKRRDTIRYGIDSEIMELLKSLGSEKDGRYDDDLLALLKASRGAKLRAAVIDFLASMQWKGAEAVALSLVDSRDEEDSSLVVSALSYLAAIKSKDALALVPKMLEENDAKYMTGLVRLMGSSGGEAEEQALLAWFDGDSTTQALKEEAIKALGDIGSAKAAERLETLVKDASGGKSARMYACAALAKIKSPGSVPALIAAANDADPNVRASAIEALASFGGAEARAAIVEGLRDSYVKSRIAACKAVGELRIVEAEPNLRYKAASDPEKAVKTEACKSLALLGGSSFEFLRERVEDKKADSAIRVLCFGLLARYDASGSLPLLEKRLRAEQAEKDRGFYTALVREIANADKAPEVGSLAAILLADKDFNMRIGGIEWIKKNKAAGMRSELERLAKDDPSEPIRKRAADALKAF
jgi:HEAT repeat protein